MKTKNQKILRINLFGLDEVSMIECNSKQKTSYITKQVHFDETGKPARVIVDFCDTYTDAVYLYRTIINQLFENYQKLVD